MSDAGLVLLVLWGFFLVLMALSPLRPDREQPLSKAQFDCVDAQIEAEAREALEYEAFIAEQRMP